MFVQRSSIGSPLTIIKTDVAKQYVDWAVNNKFAVIDVNVPKYVTDVEVSFKIQFFRLPLLIEIPRTREVTSLPIP
jgi:hypothetical protein